MVPNYKKMDSFPIFYWFLIFCLIIEYQLTSKSLAATTPTLRYSSEKSVQLDGKGVLINGQYKILRGGSLQWFRIPSEEWEDRILKFKAMGYNLIDMYVAWRNHEPQEGKYDFKTFDITHFLNLAKKHGIYVYLRPGPFITNEMDGGGYPYWVRAKANKRQYDPITSDGTMNLRTDDKDFLDAVKRYYAELNKVIKPFQHGNGNGDGPIILYSVENELDWMYGNINNDKMAELSDGLPERPIEQTPNMTNYLQKLYEFAVETGITVPITTCPGDGLLGGMGNTTSIAPFPNIYYELKSTEFAVQKLRDVLKAENSPFQSIPLGVTETTRDNWVLKRLLLGGANLISQFNIFSFHQEGRMNGMTLNLPSFYGYSSVQITVGFMENALDLNNIAHIFRMPIGLFPGNIDMNAAVTASGLLRDKFYHIKRTNMFIDAFEEDLAAREAPKRTFQSALPGLNSLLNTNTSIKVKSNLVGVSDPDLKTSKMHYWLSLSHLSNKDPRYGKAAFLSLYNSEGERDVTLSMKSIEAFGVQFPKFSELTVPYERVDMVKGDNKAAPERRYAMFIPINIPIGPVTIEYSTSEILTFRQWKHLTKPRNLVILYNVDGSKGETSILGSEKPEDVLIISTLNKSTNSVEEDFSEGPSKRKDNARRGAQEQKLGDPMMPSTSFSYPYKTTNSPEKPFQQSLMYQHQANSIYSMIYKYSEFDLQMLIVDTSCANKLWIVPYQSGEIILIGPDLVTYDQSEQTLHIQFEYPRKKPLSFKVISSSPLNLKRIAKLLNYDTLTMIGEYELYSDSNGNSNWTPEFIDKVIQTGSLLTEDTVPVSSNVSAYTMSMDNSSKSREWIQLKDQPTFLERLNVSGGHVWYEAEVELNQEDLNEKELPLWGDFASDFVSIYANGQYVLTLFPVGTEIDSTSWDKYIGFKIPMSMWKVGLNIITFKVEVWGAGSFMFPGGRIKSFFLGNVKVKLPVSKVSLPAIGCEALKGLNGNFTVNKKALKNWRFTSGLSLNITPYPTSSSIFGMFSPFPSPGSPFSRLTDERINFPIHITGGKTVWFKTIIDAKEIFPSSNNWYLPLSLELKGKNAKAAIYVNGRLIGRWISDDEWLHRGNWANPVRNLWTWFVSVDHIPLSQFILQQSRKTKHELIVQFEDVGDSTQGQHAEIQSISLISSPEIMVDVSDSPLDSKINKFERKTRRAIREHTRKGNKYDHEESEEEEVSNNHEDHLHENGQEEITEGAWESNNVYEFAQTPKNPSVKDKKEINQRKLISKIYWKWSIKI